MENSDTDLRYFIPDRWAEVSSGFLTGCGCDHLPPMLSISRRSPALLLAALAWAYLGKAA
jgi:hypothetical protein